MTGDFFAAVPEADLYLLKMVLHDWDDEQCVRILRNCRTAVRPNGRALIVEMVIGELGGPDFATPAAPYDPSSPPDHHHSRLHLSSIFVHLRHQTVTAPATPNFLAVSPAPSNNLVSSG